MRLSAKQLELLAHVELRARDPVRELAKRAGVREHTARYFLNRFHDLGIVGEARPIIDVSRLGFVHYTLLFSLASKRPKDRTAVLEALRALPMVSWLFSLGGEFHYGVSFNVFTMHELVEVLDSLGARFGHLFFNKQVATQKAFVYFGRRYLSSTARKVAPIEIAPSPDVISLTESETRVLAYLAEHGVASARAESALGLSASTLDRRRRDLEDRGVIRGYSHWVYAEKLGRHLYLMLVVIRGIAPTLRAELRSFADTHPEVTYLVEYIGAWDFELGVEVADAGRVAALTQELYDRHGDALEEVRVVPVLEHLTYRRFPSYAPADRSRS